MTEIIDSFSGAYRFLSNFYPCQPGLIWLPFGLCGKYDHFFPTTEHAFQAAKTNIPEERDRIRLAETAGIAKRLGRSVTLREDWNAVRNDVMFALLQQKFSQRSPLREALLRTGSAQLIEGNSWGDVYWGQTLDGKGENHLGQLLMLVRWHILHPEIVGGTL